MTDTSKVAPYVKRHPNGTYYLRKYLGTDPVTGRKPEAYKTLGAATFEGACREAADYLANLGRNPLLADALDDFIRSKERMRAPANTVGTYRTCANYLRPHIGRIRVHDLTTRNVNEAYMQLLEHGDRDGGPLSAGTVRTVGAFLSAAYKWLRGQGLADANPTADAMLPPKDTPEARPLDEASVTFLLESIAPVLADGSTDERHARSRNVMFAAWLALNCGLRSGEACALRRSDVFAVQGYLHVHATVVVSHGGPKIQDKTKGKKSRNVSIGPDVVRAIRAHEDWQAACFRPTPDTPLVSADGSITNNKLVSRAFGMFAHDIGLPEWVHFHTLRHTHATLVLQGGGDINTLQERLGHAQAATTLNTYGHVLPGRDREIARQVSATLGQLGGGP